MAMLATPFVETVAANIGQNKKEFKSYTVEGTLIHNVITNEEVNFPWYSADGTRASDGVVELVITIDGDEYSYPDDFSYTEKWHLELNLATITGTLTVESAYTFNLPGNPTITEWIITNLLVDEYSGIFQLTGTKMFNKVEGGGTEAGLQGLYNGETALFVDHTGLIKGWPFGE